MRRALRMLGRGCIWAAVFNTLTWLMILLLRSWEITGVSGGRLGLFMVAVGLLGAIAQDISHAILPPIDDEEL